MVKAGTLNKYGFNVPKDTVYERVDFVEGEGKKVVFSARNGKEFEKNISRYPGTTAVLIPAASEENKI